MTNDLTRNIIAAVVLFAALVHAEIKAPKSRYLDNTKLDGDDDYYDDDNYENAEESISNDLKARLHPDKSKSNTDDDRDDYYDDNVDTDEHTMDKPIHDKSFMKLATVGMPWRSYDQRHNTTSIYQQIVKNATVPTSFEILKNILEDNEAVSWEGSSEEPLPCMVPNHSRADILVDAVSRGESLHLPVINMGFPKEGTTTLKKFFSCAGMNANHDQCGNEMESYAKKGQNPLTGKDPLGVFTQMDTQYPSEKLNTLCHYPQIQLLDEIHHAYPNATFILNFRPVSDWISSINNWHDLRRRMTKCDLPGFPTGVGARDEEMVSWHCSHVRHIREFVAYHPSHALIELDLYDTDRSAKLMSTLFHASTTCWGHANTNPHAGEKK